MNEKVVKQDAIALLQELYDFYSERTEEERTKIREELMGYLRGGITDKEELTAFMKVFKCIMKARRYLRETIDDLIKLLKECLDDTFGIEAIYLDPVLDEQVKEYYDERYWEIVDAMEKSLRTGNLDAEVSKALDIFLRALDECRAYERKVRCEVLDVVSSSYEDAVRSEDWDAADFYYDLEGDLVNDYIFECDTIMDMYLYKKRHRS